MIKGKDPVRGKEWERLRVEAIKVIGIADGKREREMQEEVYRRMTGCPMAPLTNQHHWYYLTTCDTCILCGEGIPVERRSPLQCITLNKIGNHFRNR